MPRVRGARRFVAVTLHPGMACYLLSRSTMKATKKSLLLAGALAAAAAAVLVQQKTRRAERENPPSGRFVNIDGVRLHYVERGEGTPVVLLHGNGMTLQDFALSGVLELTAARYRVIAFDRPGYGYSTRPRGRRIWGPAA